MLVSIFDKWNIMSEIDIANDKALLKQPSLFPIITTDKVRYYDGDPIIISGYVTYPNPSLPVQLQVFDSKGDLAGIAQSKIQSDGKFSVILNAGGPKWESSGQYEIRAQHDDHIFSINFEYEKNIQSIGITSSDTMNLQEENKRLRQQVSSLHIQVQTLEDKIDNLNQIIQEQINVIYQWVTAR
ncbi:hypothetical protein AAA799E16_00056 [Marine Group I thaumarchaeote SCGC AAA799-E16]|uniref:Uncharacterized protein n=4 Tax=Marine Group I TaxID=905826 RepID=A0A087S8T3_9ARCH|nr:hypothetical protein AAA799E16_00056 [Marine Group I thaumarchaeote SCGC AAA799-E16]KFM17349.1 hypothetical protein AAA799D11_00146 [Marine Group I thaumarchaeote SCGC AAA799-D11]KFM19369.1 hypothetical protein SCCGRSA3_00517 [Marine Group I thaumarchaeote SCGC RSA3]KFM22137.1 hypothetical protein AAA799B03_00292 [Marine Group I thaumarchaeote SCGC AAA799-B03]